MNAFLKKPGTPGEVEKSGGVFRLKAETSRTDDLAQQARNSVRMEELAAVVARLAERMKALEEVCSNIHRP